MTVALWASLWVSGKTGEVIKMDSPVTKNNGFNLKICIEPLQCDEWNHTVY